MTQEEIKKEIEKLKQQREIAIINLHRLDGAIAAFEMMLNKTKATDANHTELQTENE